MSVKTELTKLDIRENSSNHKQDLDENLKEEQSSENNPDTYIPKETKSKPGIVFSKPLCYAKNMKFPHSKRKFVPASSWTDSSAKVVLSERNVEIKDLESKVKFLKSKVKELENENRTLQNLLSREERELKKFKEGIMDIPALLKSHKEEIKVYESTISSIRTELRDCQKELKLRNECLLKRENQIDKLNDNLKQNGKTIHEYSVEIKELKTVKKNLEDENKVLTKINENLKNENDDLYKQIKDLNEKIQNLEENVNQEKDLNRNLENDFSKLKEKYEEKLMQVSNNANIESCGNQIHSSTVNDVSDKALDKTPEDCMENTTEKLTVSVSNDTNEQNLCCIKSVDENKGGLIHNFKSCQQFCNAQLKDPVARLFEIGSNNIKMLPPLKTSFQESSPSVISDFKKKEQSIRADINFADRMKSTECDVSLQGKFTAIDSENQRSENKASVLSCDAVIKGKSNFLYEQEDLQNHKFKKNKQCIKKPHTNELKETENSSFTSKDITETKMYGNLSNPCKVRIRDNLFCESFQNTLKNKCISNKQLENEKYSCFPVASKNVSKCYKNSTNFKSLESKSNTDKHEINLSKHKSTSLKQRSCLKPIASCYQFDKISDQKFSRTQFDLSWWSK